MKNISVVLSSLAWVAIVALFVMNYSGKGGKGSTAKSPVGPLNGARIAYVNIDSFDAKYEYMKKRREEFQQKQEGMRAELENSERQMQNDIAMYQRKAQAGAMTQAEGESAERRIMQMQQSLRARQQTLTDKLIEEQEQFNEELHKELDAFLAEYNKDKKYDYILTYSRSGSIMYANPEMDVTNDVINGMNERSKKYNTTTEKK